MNEVLVNLLWGIFGIIAILIGAEIVINKSLKVSRYFGISEFFIGLTILSIGTSLPEIATHIIGSINILRGIGDAAVISGIVVGTNIGSNLIQITLITGLVGFFGILKSTRIFLKRSYIVMLSSILLLWVLSLNGYISRFEGWILVILYIVYLFFIIEKEHVISKVNHHKKSKNLYVDFLFILVGIAMLSFSSDKVVQSASFFSEFFGISGSMIGALVIGVSTAMPELTTSIVALIKRSSGMSLGTLVGSNITNPLLALGVGALISGYHISSDILYFDLPVWFFVSLFPLAFFWKNLTLKKKGALVLISLYLIYFYFRITLFV